MPPPHEVVFRVVDSEMVMGDTGEILIFFFSDTMGALVAFFQLPETK
jgi:hypothetical protein